MNEQLDPQVVNMAKAIRQSESGGDFKAQGKSGEYGAYQFTEPIWNKTAQKYGINTPLKDSTPEEQNQVAYKRIKEWKDSGKNIGQVASMWNAGEGEPDAYLGKFSDGSPSVGINKSGVKFDVPTYAQSVAKAYQTLKGGGQVQADQNNPSAVEQKPGVFQGIVQNLASPFLKVASSVNQLAHANPNDMTEFNKIRDEGTDFGYFGKQTPVGAVKGGINSVGDFAKGVSDALGTGANIGLDVVTGAGALRPLTKAASLTRIIENPTVANALETVVGKGGASQLKTEGDVYNALSEAIKNVSPYDKLILTRQLQKVLEPSILKQIVTGAGKALWGVTKFGTRIGADIAGLKGLSLLK